jgi:hypothetical protein
LAWEYRVIPMYCERDKWKFESLGRTHEIAAWQWVGVFSDREPLGFEAVCDVFGSMGWELVSTQVTGNIFVSSGSPLPMPNRVQLFFKRPKAE